MRPHSTTRADPAVWAGVFGVAALAWALTARLVGEAMMGGPTMGRSMGGFLAVWTLMMVAMMLPSVAPLVDIYAHGLRRSARGPRLFARAIGLVAGYLAVWAVFGLAAFAFGCGAERVVRNAPAAAPWVAAGLLALVALYQLTPIKNRCLTHCRSPLGFLLRLGHLRGPLRDVRVGLSHGSYCVGCCWGLMVALLVLGVMDIAWMAVLAAVVLLEKTWRYGRRLSLVFAVVLFVLACAIPLDPDLAAGLRR